MLHPGNIKQSFPLALAIFYETTIASDKSYYPDRKDLSGFLTIINTWWKISNLKTQFSPNKLGNATVESDGKADFLTWIENWSSCPSLTLLTQISKVLFLNSLSHVVLTNELLSEGYKFLMTGRFQSDPIESSFLNTGR